MKVLNLQDFLNAGVDPRAASLAAALAEPEFFQVSNGKYIHVWDSGEDIPDLEVIQDDADLKAYMEGDWSVLFGLSK